jgi:hypothetical protein
MSNLPPVLTAFPQSLNFLKMKTLFTILFYIATGLYVCLSYLLVQMIDKNGKFELVILDLVGLMANVILINFLLRKFIN